MKYKEGDTVIVTRKTMKEEVLGSYVCLAPIAGWHSVKVYSTTVFVHDSNLRLSC